MFPSGKPTFSQEKMVLGRKTNFFLGKTKKIPKKHLLGNYAAKVQNDGFFLRKRWFCRKNKLFPRKKMVLA